MHRGQHPQKPDKVALILRAGAQEDFGKVRPQRRSGYARLCGDFLWGLAGEDGAKDLGRLVGKVYG